MKLIKTSAIALAMSAVLAGPVLAQGTSADPQVRGGAQGKGSMQKGMSGSGDEDFNAQPGTPGERTGTSTKSKGTVGAFFCSAKPAVAVTNISKPPHSSDPIKRIVMMCLPGIGSRTGCDAAHSIYLRGPLTYLQGRHLAGWFDPTAPRAASATSIVVAGRAALRLDVAAALLA